MEDQTYTGWWHCGEKYQPENIDPKALIGFVYIVTNLTNGKQYLGKKLFNFRGFKKERGKKRRRVLIESDWKTYYGSSEDVQADVKALGEKSFKREILHLCTSKAWCSYLEAREIFSRDALLYPDKFYNLWISARVRRAHLVKK